MKFVNLREIVVVIVVDKINKIDKTFFLSAPFFQFFYILQSYTFEFASPIFRWQHNLSKKWSVLCDIL
jgi:hypothetical protein